MLEHMEHVNALLPLSFTDDIEWYSPLDDFQKRYARYQRDIQTHSYHWNLLNFLSNCSTVPCVMQR